MQGTNWVKVSEQYPKSCKFILFYADGEVRAGWMINLGDYFYDSYKRKWFFETEVSHWCDLPLPPMPEGE
ncbi:DUF551 domain-containing protein [Providencia alcalifaciens]|uniref:DUF551 domain-containing protein n=1 Tax=Providencia alcalifaciens TaxID=126385 RepID=UPI0012B5A8D5|nr:DUF551 domain-containing protein [Providencia alcalifaciens]MTC54949.1 DUF551 domain-containing protein [Providencia alcalifaciens]